MRNTNKALAGLAFAGALAASSVARAQDAGPDQEEVKKKVIEIERLMKGAEEALARSTDTRSAAERSAEAAKKLLDQKAKKETGKSSAELRKEAESGSEEAKKTLERLTQAAESECKEAAEKMAKLGGAGGSSGGAGQGVRDLLEKVKGEGKGASDGIEWLVKQVKPSGGGGSAEKPQQPQEDAKDPKKKDKPEDKPDDTTKKPPDANQEPPRNPEFEQWVADLPAQIRKAVETEDWDSIPPKWRDMLKAWTKKMADEKDPTKERR